MSKPDQIPTDTDSRIGWVDYAKGICMIGVVTVYAVNKLKMAGGDGGWLAYWADFAKPFRMPDFFLLSGLFLGRVIDRPWRIYFDKKVTHYLYFFVLWSGIFFVSRSAALHFGLFHSEEEAGSLWYKLLEPFAMLWFIQMLPIFFIVTRLLRSAPAWAVLTVAALLQIFPPSEAVRPSMIVHFCERFIYFYVGYRFAPEFFALAARAQARRGLALLGLVTWIFINEMLVLRGFDGSRGISLVLGISGAMGVITAGALLQHVRGTAWLRYFGRNSLVIYLGFYLPMLLILALARRTNGFLLDQGTLGLLVSGISVLAALSLFWATRRNQLSFLFARPGWAHGYGKVGNINGSHANLPEFHKLAPGAERRAAGLEGPSGLNNPSASGGRSL